MLNTIAQIALGIMYGLYLAILAPTSQRQKAHELLKQHAVIPTLQEEPMLSQVEALIGETTTQPALELDMVKDPWLTKPAPVITENQENTAAIAIVSPVPTLLLLPPAQLDHKQTSKASSRRKTKAPKTKRAKTKVQVSDTVAAALSETTVA